MSIHKTIEFSGHSGAIYSIDAADGYIYSSGADKFVVRWNIAKGEQDKFAIQLPKTAYAIRLFNADKYLAVGLSNGDIHIFDIEKRKEVKFYQQHSDAIFCIYENEDTKQLIVADAIGNLSIWDAQSLQFRLSIPLNCGKIRRMLSVDNELFLFSQNGEFIVLDALNFNELKRVNAHKDGVTSGEFIGKNLLLTGGKDAHLKLWDTTIYQNLESIPAHNFVIYDILALGTHFVTASRDKTIKLWDADAMKVIDRVEKKQGGHAHSVNALSKLGEKEFASASDDGKIMCWRI